MSDNKRVLQVPIIPLTKAHKRDNFSCGLEPLDRYLKTQASQDVKRSIAAPFVCTANDDSVIGYYTLSSFSVELSTLPASQIKKLPKYPIVPATLLGRLAVHQNYHGQGLGEHLLMDALARSHKISAEIASYAVIVDAKNDVAITFYQTYGFISFPEYPNRLFLTMKQVAKLFS